MQLIITKDKEYLELGDTLKEHDMNNNTTPDEIHKTIQDTINNFQQGPKTIIIDSIPHLIGVDYASQPDQSATVIQNQTVEEMQTNFDTFLKKLQEQTSKIEMQIELSKRRSKSSSHSLYRTLLSKARDLHLPNCMTLYKLELRGKRLYKDGNRLGLHKHNSYRRKAKSSVFPYLYISMPYKACEDDRQDHLRFILDDLEVKNPYGIVPVKATKRNHIVLNGM